MRATWRGPNAQPAPGCTRCHATCRPAAASVRSSTTADIRAPPRRPSRSSRAPRAAARASGATNEADALLKRGAALVAAGRRPDGIATLQQADDVATRALALETRAKEPREDVQANLTQLSYFARLQAGDALREAGELTEALESYRAAGERRPALRGPLTTVQFAALDLNRAITLIALGRPREALTAATATVRTEPLNPAFLMTQAYAAERAGQPALSERLDRAALRADPSTYPAANDLGVLLARRGHEVAATAMLRRAVGANENYALGWFNLGIVLGAGGPGTCSRRRARSRARSRWTARSPIAGASSPLTRAPTAPASTSPRRCPPAGASPTRRAWRPRRRSRSRRCCCWPSGSAGPPPDRAAAAAGWPRTS